MSMLDISIHTTRKVVTESVSHGFRYVKNFNPHHPQGGDKGYQEGRHFNDDFNPHHPQGGDTMPSRLLKQSRYFNPHHPQGGDDDKARGILDKYNFNPHHPQGGDAAFLPLSHRPAISIHTTRKVVTPLGLLCLRLR